MGRHSTVERVSVDGQPAWVTHYGAQDHRVIRRATQRWLALRLDIQPLVPSPRRRGAHARYAECRSACCCSQRVPARFVPVMIRVPASAIRHRALWPSMRVAS